MNATSAGAWERRAQRTELEGNNAEEVLQHQRNSISKALRCKKSRIVT